MARYTNRTCHNCGIRKPQPEMYQKEIYVESGRSRAGVSKGTVLASMLGDEKAEKQVYNSIWNTNQRTYQRKKNVWVYGSCRGGVKTRLGFWQVIRDLIITAVVLFLGMIVLIALFA